MFKRASFTVGTAIGAAKGLKKYLHMTIGVLSSVLETAKRAQSKSEEEHKRLVGVQLLFHPTTASPSEYTVSIVDLLCAKHVLVQGEDNNDDWTTVSLQTLRIVLKLHLQEHVDLLELPVRLRLLHFFHVKKLARNPEFQENMKRRKDDGLFVFPDFDISRVLYSSKFTLSTAGALVSLYLDVADGTKPFDDSNKTV